MSFPENFNPTVIDLTHKVASGMPVWPGDPDTRLKKVATLGANDYNLNELTIGEHTGTHFGAPLHFLNKRRDAASFKVEELFVKAVKLNVRDLVESVLDFLLQPEHVLEWESKNGVLPTGYMAIVETGWSQYWGDPQKYFGLVKEGLHFPGVSLEAAKLIVSKRGAVGIGIDSPGIDGSQQKFPVNYYLAQNSAYHIENLTNLCELSENGMYVFVGVLPIEAATGSPCRVIALQ